MKSIKRFIAYSLCAVSVIAALQAGELEDDFRDPPMATKPYVWWHWMGSNFSKEGITKDLEAMKAAGIAGATIFNLTSAVQESHRPIGNNPWPEQTYRSPAYWEALRHAAKEADRLGLDLGLHNTVGYSTTGGPWIDEPRNMQQIVWTSVEVDGGTKIETKLERPAPVVYKGWGSSGRTHEFFQDIAVLAVPAEGTIEKDQIIDLTEKFRDGQLTWDAPAGKWRIFRLAHAPTGANPHPVPDELIGIALEADKMSLDVTKYHWDQVIDPLKEHLGPLLGKSFRHFLIDSYEAGNQNWTPDFRKEFEKRKGYDPLPWLMTKTPETKEPRKEIFDRIVGSEDMTRRFWWDFRDVVADLYYTNGWKPAAEKIHSVGCLLDFEPYHGPFDMVEATTVSDIPMGEFWTFGKGGINPAIVAAARAAGRPVVAAEAFTGRPEVSKWTETPAFLKPSADGTFASGVNRMVLHHWVHQPFDDKYQPGFGMGWWGTHFSRFQTWFEPGKAFFKYLARIQAVLQRGEAPADFVSVGAPQGGDVIPWRTFREGLEVKEGAVVLPSGRTYPFLSVPHDGALSPDDVRRIAALLEKGATVVASKPDRAPGLKDYPKADDEVRKLASEIWGDDADGDREVGKGRLRRDLGATIEELGITPAFGVSGNTKGDVRITHRRDEEADIFFVANAALNAQAFTASFRVEGRRPEIWDPETGEMTFAPVWRAVGGRTEVDLRMETDKSLFVVFRKSELPRDHVVKVTEQKAPSPVTPLKILSATFGPESGSVDVTEKIRKLAEGKSILDVEVKDESMMPVVAGQKIPDGVKSLRVEYESDGENQSTTVVAGRQRLRIGTPGRLPDYSLEGLEDGGLRVSAGAETVLEVEFASGKKVPVELTPPKAQAVKGPWSVDLASPVQEAKTLTLPGLVSLSKNEEPDVRYFSGTATYRTEFDLPDPGKSPVVLDLGDVRDLVRVRVNGKDLGVLWHPPFRVEIGSALRPGKNKIELAVTNTWHNRLVGDEQHPADFEWGEDRGVDKGRAMKAFPDWFVKNQDRPEKGRKGFVTWFYHRADTPLLPSGLLGPVALQTQASRTISPP